MHFEGLIFNRLPFVETGLAQGDGLGAGLQARAADAVEVDEVGHRQEIIRASPFGFHPAIRNVFSKDAFYYARFNRASAFCFWF